MHKTPRAKMHKCLSHSSGLSIILIVFNKNNRVWLAWIQQVSVSVLECLNQLFVNQLVGIYSGKRL